MPTLSEADVVVENIDPVLCKHVPYALESA